VLLVLALVSVLLVRQGGPSWQVFSLAGASPAGVAGGSVMALMAFVGFESATVLGAETRSPLKTLPRALLWTALSTGVFYLLTAYTQLAGFEQLGLPLAGSNAPFVDLAVAGEAPGLLVALDAAIALSFVACALASATALVRVLFTMGREGVLPSWAGQAHPKFKTPHRAIGASLPMVVAGPLVFLAAGFTPWAAMNALVTCAAAGFVAAYILTCIALPLFLRRIGEVTARPVVLALLAAALLSGTLVVYIGEAFRGPQGTGGWIFLSIVAAASLWYGWKRRADPGLSRRLGIYDEPTREDLLRPAGDP
jgi:amino acid transporter